MSLKKEKELQSGVRHRKISIHLFLSYMIILAAPTVAIVFIYFTAQTALLNVQKERAYRLLSETVTNFDNQMEEIKNVGLHISENSDLCKMISSSKEKNRSKEFYSMYLLAKQFPDYSMTNQVISNIYLLFPGKDYLINLPMVAPVTTNGFSTVNTFGTLNYDGVIDLFCKDYMTGTIMNVGSPKKTNLFMVQSAPNITSSDYKGAVVISLNDASIRRLMENSLLDSNCNVFILDRDGMIIKELPASKKTGSLSDAPASRNLNKYLKDNNMKKSEVVLNTIQSSYNEWSFVTVTPEKVMLKKVGYMKYVIILFSIASILIGYAICFIYWYKRKETVKRYCDCSDNIVGAESRKTGSFWDGLAPFLESVESLQSTVKMQRPILMSAIIQRLLYGNYDSKEELKADMECVGMELNAPRYYVVVLEFEDPLKDSIFNSMEEFQESVQGHFKENLQISHMLYEVNQLLYAMIVPDFESHSSKDIKQKIELLNYKFYYEKRLQIYAGISEASSALLKLCRLYDEALSFCDYGRFHGIRVPILKEDLPSNVEVFTFSIEMEIHLENAIKKGTMEELERVIKEINDYYLEKTLGLSMTKHLMEMLRCTVIRSLEKVSKDEKVAEILQSIQETKMPEEVFDKIREAKRYFLQHIKLTEDDKAMEMKKYLSKRIEDEYKDPNFSLVYLADELKLSENKLYKDFKNYFGITFSEYLEQVRIRQACEMLKEGTPVKEVAILAGYGSDYSFRRAFKRVMGIPPSDLQKK